MRKYLDSAVIIGRKGLDGRLTVKMTAGLPFLFEEGMELFIVPPRIDLPRRVRIYSIEQVNGDEAVMRFFEVDDIDTAEGLIGCHILVCTEDIKGDISEVELEIYTDGLEGWSLSDANSGFSGAVIEMNSYGPQMLLTVQGEDGISHLVPFAEELVASIDEGEKKIVINAPKGLFEI